MRRAEKNTAVTAFQSNRFYTVVSAPAIAVLLLLFFMPLLIILSRGFISDEGRFTLGLITEALGDPYILRVIVFTIIQSAVSTAGALAIGLPGAYLLSHYSFRGKRLVQAVATIPFILPSILVVLGFVIFYGNTGVLNTILMKLFNLSEPPVRVLYSFKAIILAHTFYNFPIILSIVANYWQQLPLRPEQAAQSLGATKAHIFRTITLPRLLPAIISASTLVFLFCFSSFAILLVLGGGPQFTTLEVEIYQRARMAGDISGSSALAMISIFIALILVTFYSISQQKMKGSEEISSSQVHREPRRMKSLLMRVFISFYILFTVIFILGPLLSITYRSLFAQVSRTGPMVFSLDNYRILFSSMSDGTNTSLLSIFNSVLIAFGASFISVTLGVLLSSRIVSGRRKDRVILEVSAMLPMVVSSVTLGLGYYMISVISSRWNINRILFVVLAHVVITSPFVLRSILPTYRRIPASYQMASLTLGASASRTFWKIDLPLLRNALASAGAFGFAISMGELQATLTLSDSRIITLPITMYRLIGSYNFAAACALGTILMGVCIMIFLSIEYLKKGEVQHGFSSHF